jgi:hypothetical protein
MNPEHRPNLGQDEKYNKSRGEPRLIAPTYLRIASHSNRSPRLTLKAGRRAGCIADGSATRRGAPQNQSEESANTVRRSSVVGAATKP